MRNFELTLPTTAKNLALDEWLLDQSDQGDQPIEYLRLWENPVQAVILGRSSKVNEEINRDVCTQKDIEYFRRSSGGASVVIGPGCLMYSLVLDYRLRPDLRMLDRVHRLVMETLVKALTKYGLEIRFQGTCDLTLQGRKFSGNSLRCKRNSLLYHGTLLYDFPLSAVQELLGTPPRQPDYREQRSHDEFVANLPIGRQSLVDALKEAWAGETIEPAFIDMDQVTEMAASKYSSKEWNDKR